MEKEFNKMIKSELEEAIENYGIREDVEALAKDPKKITNAEYVSALEINKQKLEDEQAEKDKKSKEAEEKKTVKKSSKLSVEEKKVVMTEDLHTAIPVIVTDHDTSVIIEEDEEGRCVPIRWGNPTIGMQTTNVAMHGRMQYLPKGAVIRLKRITLADHVKTADGKEQSKKDRLRFSVAETQGWTEAEFEAHKKEQALKKL